MISEALILAGLRGLHLAALAFSAGALTVALLSGGPLPGKGAQALRWSLAVALATGLGWLGWQAALSTGRPFPDAQWLMLTQTGFGRVMALRLGLIAAALALPRWRLVPLLAAMALQPLLGHGAAAEPRVALSGAAHGVSGLVWAGSLVWLWWLARVAPRTALTAARRFSPLGVALILMLGAGAVGQWPLVGGFQGLLGTTFGHLLLVKSALLMLMLACAALNGLWFAPDGRLGALRRSLSIEALAGIAAVLAAAWLALQVPGVHDRVIWPFERQPFPGLWQDDFLRGRLLRMARPLAIAAGALLLALLFLRVSKLASAGMAVVAAVSLWLMPLFPPAPFLRPALPTSFRVAETRRTPVSILQGQQVYARDCVACHNHDLRGAGPGATGDPVWPPDLTATWFLSTRDGDWFWRIRHGMADRDGRASMPGFPELDDDAVWQVIDYLRAGASARSLTRQGRWQIPPGAPVIRLRCEGRRGMVDLSRPAAGQAIYWGGTVEVPGDVLALGPDTCGPLDATTRAALAVLAGGTLTAEASFLVDPAGYLRQIWVAPPAPSELAETLDWIRANPWSGSAEHH